MTDQEILQMNMSIARKGLQHENDVRREGFDVVPRTLLCSGIVFLSLVVPLYFNQAVSQVATRACFRISAISMFVSLMCSGCLFERTIRVSTTTIRMLQEVARGTNKVDAIGIQMFRKWEWCVFVAMCISFVVSIGALITAMFLQCQ